MFYRSRVRRLRKLAKKITTYKNILNEADDEEVHRKLIKAIFKYRILKTKTYYDKNGNARK